MNLVLLNVFVLRVQFFIMILTIIVMDWMCF